MEDLQKEINENLVKLRALEVESPVPPPLSSAPKGETRCPNDSRSDWG